MCHRAPNSVQEFRLPYATICGCVDVSETDGAAGFGRANRNEAVEFAKVCARKQAVARLRALVAAMLSTTASIMKSASPVT